MENGFQNHGNKIHSHPSSTLNSPHSWWTQINCCRLVAECHVDYHLWAGNQQLPWFGLPHVPTNGEFIGSSHLFLQELYFALWTLHGHLQKWVPVLQGNIYIYSNYGGLSATAMNHFFVSFWGGFMLWWILIILEDTHLSCWIGLRAVMGIDKAILPQWQIAWFEVWGVLAWSYDMKLRFVWRHFSAKEIKAQRAPLSFVPFTINEASGNTWMNVIWEGSFNENTIWGAFFRGPYKFLHQKKNGQKKESPGRLQKFQSYA